MSMIKKVITYEDLNGNEITEDFYFCLTKTECIEKNMTTPGGYVELLERIIKAKDGPALYGAFKEFILDAYGVKSDDGKRFIKSDELRKEFEQCPAYDILMQELMSGAGVASDFLTSILPKIDKADAQIAEAAKNNPKIMELT